MAAKTLIQFLRGAVASAPVLADGEPGWATDTHTLYVGQSGTNYPVSGSSAGTAVADEVPSGTINGSNAAFTLANTPIVGTLVVYVNGLEQSNGIGFQYVLSGTTITFNTAAIPVTGDVLTVNYSY